MKQFRDYLLVVVLLFIIAWSINYTLFYIFVGKQTVVFTGSTKEVKKFIEDKSKKGFTVNCMTLMLVEYPKHLTVIMDK